MDNVENLKYGNMYFSKEDYDKLIITGITPAMLRKYSPKNHVGDICSLLNGSATIERFRIGVLFANGLIDEPIKTGKSFFAAVQLS